MGLRRTTSRMLAAAVLVAALCSGCGAQKPARSQGPAGKIEALREAQEKAQQKIEAEGRTSAQAVKRQQEATLAEAQAEREDRAAQGR
jgi:hypothetical protein